MELVSHPPDPALEALSAQGCTGGRPVCLYPSVCSMHMLEQLSHIFFGIAIVGQLWCWGYVHDRIQ